MFMYQIKLIYLLEKKEIVNYCCLNIFVDLKLEGSSNL